MLPYVIVKKKKKENPPNNLCNIKSGVYLTGVGDTPS